MFDLINMNEFTQGANFPTMEEIILLGNHFNRMFMT